MWSKTIAKISKVKLAEIQQFTRACRGWWPRTGRAEGRLRRPRAGERTCQLSSPLPLIPKMVFLTCKVPAIFNIDKWGCTFHEIWILPTISISCPAPSTLCLQDIHIFARTMYIIHISYLYYVYIINAGIKRSLPNKSLPYLDLHPGHERCSASDRKPGAWPFPVPMAAVWEIPSCFWVARFLSVWVVCCEIFADEKKRKEKKLVYKK